MSGTAIPSDLQTVLQDIRKVQYLELIPTVILVYDHLITLGQEIELIWKSRWTFGKCLFLVNRYYFLFGFVFNNYVLFNPNVPSTLCEHWLRWQGVNGTLAFVIGELILQLRVAALYNLKRKVMVIMVCTFSVALGISSTIMGIVLSREEDRLISIHLPGISVSTCTIINLDSLAFYWTFWLPIIASESVLCALVVLRAIERMRANRHTRKAFTWVQNGHKLIIVLIRDSILYFFVLLAVCLTNTVLFHQNDVTTIECAAEFLICFTCVMGNRLCLNVRDMVSTSPSTWSVSSERSVKFVQRNIQLETASSVTSPVAKAGPQRWHSMTFSPVTTQHEEVEIGELTEYEMRELRDMRSDV